MGRPLVGLEVCSGPSGAPREAIKNHEVIAARAGRTSSLTFVTPKSDTLHWCA